MQNKQLNDFCCEKFTLIFKMNNFQKPLICVKWLLLSIGKVSETFVFCIKIKMKVRVKK